LHDGGFPKLSGVECPRFYGDVGYRNDGSEFHSTWESPATIRRVATVPVELLQNYWARPIPRRRPQPTRRVTSPGPEVEATPTWTVEGSAHVRVFQQKTVDGQKNPSATQPCAAHPTLLCL